ncbi:collagen binding domain-containing protein [uncultured Amnibacterium sp.]|uniref:MSCRAMM family protein n=1 Tax=uncultured Amnibacterium sp. TaxID=1631851 RepID=UPI0035CC0ACD
MVHAALGRLRIVTTAVVAAAVLLAVALLLALAPVPVRSAAAAVQPPVGSAGTPVSTVSTAGMTSSAGGLAGHVIGTSAVSGSRATVTLRVTNGPVVAVARTNRSGAFAFHDLATADYTVTTHPTGVLQVSARRVVVPEATVVADLRLRTGGSITGRAIRASTGKPVPHLGVELLGAHDRHLRTVTTNASGTYTLGGLGAGAYKLHFAAPTAGASRTYVQAWQAVQVRADAATHEDGYVQRGGRLTGRIVGVDGRPVAGATVRAVGRDKVMHATVASAKGEYTVRGLASGGYAIFLWDPRHRSAGTKAGGVAVAEQTRTANLRMAHHPATISGRVTEGTHAAATRGGAVTALSSTGQWYSAPISSTGHFVLKGLGVGTYRLRAIPFGAYAQTTVPGPTVRTATVYPDADVHLTAWGAALTGAVHDPDGAALAGIGVSLVDRAGTKVAYVKTDADGSYALGSALPTGTYTAAFHSYATGKTVRVAGVVLARGQRVRLSQVLPPK